MTYEELIARRKRIETETQAIVHSMPLVFETIPGMPENADMPKADEGMEAFRTKVYAAIQEKGWNVYQNENAQYDFIITELYMDSVICQDLLTAKFYKIPVSVSDDGDVTLGDPIEYDITYVPAEDSPEPTSEPSGGSEMAMDRRDRRLRTQASDLVLSAVDADKGIYEILICNSGFAKRWTRINGKTVQMYMPEKTLVDAAASGRFDAGRCFWQHPKGNREETGEPKRERLLFGYIVPKSASVVPNKAGGVDVMAKLKVISTSAGDDIKVILDEQIALGVPLIENSIFSEGADLEIGTAEGRDALICSKINERCDVDFVDEAAFPRSSVRSRLAASAQTNTTKGNLSMEDKQRLDMLTKTVGELTVAVKGVTDTLAAEKKRADDLALERTIDEELGASGLKPDEQALVKPTLMAMADPTLRKSHLELAKRVYLGSATRSTTHGNGATDTPPAENKEPKRLRDDVQAMVDRAAQSSGIKLDVLKQAQLTVMGSAE